MVETPDQYIQVLTTGTLEPLIEGKQAELMNIRSENEALADGRPVIALLTDNHALHISEHKCVLSSPEARMNKKIVETTLVHIQEHITQLQTLTATNPTLLAILGQQPAMGPPPQAAGPMAAAPVTEVGTPEARLPSLPKNPLTGKPFTPTNGGLQ
jgi:hypothetical protein